MQSGNTDISVSELAKLIANDQATVIDVRSPKEVAEFGRIPKSVNIPDSDEFQNKYGIKKPDLAHKYLIFSCQKGPRSATALAAAQKLGYKSARMLVGGYAAWAEAK